MLTRAARWIAPLLLAGFLVAPGRPAAQVAYPDPVGVTISGVDSHDGMVFEADGQLFWVGTRYGCGWTWQSTVAPWCGFGVWTADELAGPWTYVRDLFNPYSTSGTWKNESWQTVCRWHGCFNPRMVQRPDGVWVLWFNAPGDLARWGANGFWAMGCAGPAGPCGFGAGPNGSTIKPSLWVCTRDGDFSVAVDGATAWLACGTDAHGHSVNVERLAPWWADGTGVGTTHVAGLSYREGAGLARLDDGRWLLTAGSNCPYCSGGSTEYAIGDTPLGPWRTPPGTDFRRWLSAHSCGGQPRTLTRIGGQLYQQIDTWTGAMSQPTAATRLEPLIPTGMDPLGPVDGQPWPGPYRPFTCV